MTIKQIRDDLKDIRYFYSMQKLFEQASRSVVQNSVHKKVDRYNKAIKDAPVKLYALYITLYVDNNSQATIADDWNLTPNYIKELNLKLCEYLLRILNSTEELL